MEAHFSQVVLEDNLARLAGIVAADFPESQAELGDVEKETPAVLNAIDSMLKEIGLEVGRIVRVNVHLEDLGDLDTMDATYGE